MTYIDAMTSDAQILADRRFKAAEEILHERTGLYFHSAIPHYGSIAAVLKAHPDIAPGFSGLPFEAVE